MTRHTWVRLDNASNIFLAARSEADPKVFRLSAEMDHLIDPSLLQEALDITYERYPLYHAVLRSGIFWYYLQDSDLAPVVTVDYEHTCAPIYQPDRRTLLFRVVYFRKRIILEIFHALSDGTGALWFLTDLVIEYTRLRYPDEFTQLDTESDVSGRSIPETAEQEHGLTVDSFAKYFRKPSRKVTDSAAQFAGHAAPVISGILARDLSSSDKSNAPIRLPHSSGRKIYRVKGTRTPDNRTRAVELTMPVSQVLALARAEGVSLTIYLTALFFEAIRLSSGGLGEANTLTASVPVNLRQFFPSTSPRNFFATTRVEHTYGEGKDDFTTICQELEAQFREKVTPQALEAKLRRFIRLERMPALRIVPRILKDVVLGLGNRTNNRGLTVAISNLGLVRLPEPADSHLGRMLLQVSAARPQFCSVSHAGMLAVCFTSPFTELGHVKEFVRMLTSQQVEVTMAVARVTEEELVGAGP
ncbi:MAG: alcohol acetyltransferase [Propionibacterium sp.]|nr:alcohol acetyltransferase [Propionibacterium sp.]